VPRGITQFDSSCICRWQKSGGFDLNPEALKASAQLALHNAVHKRIRFGIECDHGQLNALCQNHTLVVCDIEGGEKDLIDPAFAPNLHFADLLIELHPIEGSTSILEQLSSASRARITAQ
jgi:hypothetical protein